MKTVITLTEQQQEFLKSQSTHVFDGEESWYQLPNHWYKPIGDDRYEISETGWEPTSLEGMQKRVEVIDAELTTLGNERNFLKNKIYWKENPSGTF